MKERKRSEAHESKRKKTRTYPRISRGMWATGIYMMSFRIEMIGEDTRIPFVFGVRSPWRLSLSWILELMGHYDIDC